MSAQTARADERGRDGFERARRVANRNAKSLPACPPVVRRTKLCRCRGKEKDRGVKKGGEKELMIINTRYVDLSTCNHGEKIFVETKKSLFDRKHTNEYQRTRIYPNDDWYS